MITDTQLERAFAPPREDARDLIARLCHELGVNAVAEALAPPQEGTASVEAQEAPAPRIDRAA